MIRRRPGAQAARAIGVASAQSLEPIGAEADEVVCRHGPADFYAVGQFFDDFSEVTDEMVVTALSGRTAPSSAGKVKADARQAVTS